METNVLTFNGVRFIFVYSATSDDVFLGLEAGVQAPCYNPIYTPKLASNHSYPALNYSQIGCGVYGSSDHQVEYIN